MDLWKSIKNRVSGWWSIIVAMPVHMRLLGVVFIVLSAIFFAVMFSESTEKCIADLLGLKEKSDTLKFLGIGMGGILLVVQAMTSYRRAKAMEDAAKAQADAAKAQAKATEQQAKANQNTEEGQRQERLKNAIEHLGHPSDSVRLGGAYELFHLAKDTEELCQTVLDILCAHIRRTTGESKYRKEHKSKPSEEVQSLLTLMFVEEHAVFKGCGINLQGSWLNGANLESARLQGATLVEAQLQGAKLPFAQLQGAMLFKAQLQGAELNKAQLQGAKLFKAQLQGAELDGAQLQGAMLGEAQLQGARLFKAQLQGAELNKAQLQGAKLFKAQLQGAELFKAQLQGAELFFAQLQGAELNGAQLQGAELNGAQLQGAELDGAQLQGVESSFLDFSELFEDRIRRLIGKVSDLSGVVFGGGSSRQDVDSLVEGLSDEKAKDLRVKLEPHIDKPSSYELPEDSDAVTGVYTKEEAERWIAEYKQAMSKVPGRDDG